MEIRVDIATIRKELEFNIGRFPKNAVQSAIEQRDAMIPVLLAALQEVAEDPVKMLQEPSPMPTHLRDVPAGAVSRTGRLSLVG